MRRARLAAPSHCAIGQVRDDPVVSSRFTLSFGPPSLSGTGYSSQPQIPESSLTERSKQTSPQVIVNMFSRWYEQIGFDGCSSHSGRRTFITNAARKISLVGGSLRDVQMLAGHTSLRVTQRYIDADQDAQRKIVELI